VPEDKAPDWRIPSASPAVWLLAVFLSLLLLLTRHRDRHRREQRRAAVSRAGHPGQRTLNPRVRGSSPWRPTRTDLGFYRYRSISMCLICPYVCSMFAPATVAPVSRSGGVSSGRLRHGRTHSASPDRRLEDEPHGVRDGRGFGGHRFSLVASPRCAAAVSRSRHRRWNPGSRPACCASNHADCAPSSPTRDFPGQPRR
jgi:hypothetical protein